MLCASCSRWAVSCLSSWSVCALQLLMKSLLLGPYLVLGVYLCTATCNPRTPERNRRGHDRATAGQESRLPGRQILPGLILAEQNRHPRGDNGDDGYDDQSHPACTAGRASAIAWPGPVGHTDDYRSPPRTRASLRNIETAVAVSTPMLVALGDNLRASPATSPPPSLRRLRRRNRWRNG